MSWRKEVARALAEKPNNSWRRDIDWSKIEIGEARLTDDQKGAITEAYAMEGAVLVLVVGAGKTLVSLILTKLMGKRTLLLLPANLKQTVQAEYEKWKSEFAIELPRMMSYSYISRNEGALDQAQPDFIIADESFYLGNAESTRTGRVIKYLEDNPDTMFVSMAGTLGPFEKYSTVMEMALGTSSPVPLHGSAHTAWSHMTDSRQEITPYEWEKIRPLDRSAHTREEYQVALRAHLERSPGVYLTKDDGIPTSLRIFYHKKIVLGDEVLRTIDYMLENLEIPDGDTFASDAQKIEACTQVLQGFYYSWDWGTTPKKTRIRWTLARRELNLGIGAFIEDVKKKTGRVLSPQQALQLEDIPTWLMKSKERWINVSTLATPARRVTTLASPNLTSWSTTVGTRPLIWHRHTEVPSTPWASSWPSYTEHSQTSLRKRRCFIQTANAVGKNLQADWNENVLIYLPNDDLLEQLIGRTHRRGQTEDEVHVHIPACHPILMRKIHNIKSDARDAHRVKGERHKVLYADEVWL